MNELFFWASKLFWLLIAPDHFLLILLSVSAVCLIFGRVLFGKRLLFCVMAVVWLIALLPVGEWLLYPLETRFKTNPELPEKLDGIIVLSGAEGIYQTQTWQQPEFSDGAERNLAFMHMARQYPRAKKVFTGGSGSMIAHDYKAADVARLLFEQQGLDVQSIIFERQSRNTYENAIFSKQLVKPKKGEHWLLITTAWHMPRSVGIFCKAGWSVLAYPVDHWTRPDKLFRVDINLATHLNTLNTAVREWLGLVAYYLTGKTTAILPRGCNA